MQGPLICLANARGGRHTACLFHSTVAVPPQAVQNAVTMCRRYASRGLFAAINTSGKASRQPMYGDEESEGGSRDEEEKEKKPAKKKRVQRPHKARPATKKKRPREGEQQEGPTDGKKQQPATQQQQQLSKPQKAPKEPSKAQKRAKAKDDTSSKPRYEVIAPKRAKGPPQVLTKKQLEEVERIAGEDAEEAEEDRIADLAYEPFYTHEGEEVRVTFGRGLRLMRCCLVSCCSALAEGSCATL